MDEVLMRPFVSVIAIDTTDRHSRILLQRRTKPADRPEYYGLWELPQGKIRAGETLFEAARRELKEESGLEALALDPIHRATIDPHSDTLHTFAPLTCVYDTARQCLGLPVIVSTTGQPHDTSEATEHTWMTQGQVIDLISSGMLFPMNRPMLEQFYRVYQFKD